MSQPLTLFGESVIGGFNRSAAAMISACAAGPDRFHNARSARLYSFSESSTKHVPPSTGRTGPYDHFCSGPPISAENRSTQHLP